MAYLGMPYQQPYGNPYGYPLTGPQSPAGAPQAAICQITRVNGRNGADAFRMAPNSPKEKLAAYYHGIVNHETGP